MPVWGNVFKWTGVFIKQTQALSETGMRGGYTSQGSVQTVTNSIESFSFFQLKHACFDLNMGVCSCWHPKHGFLKVVGRTDDASCTNTTAPQGDTRAPFCARGEHESHIGVVFIESTRFCFVNLQNGRTNTRQLKKRPPARMPGRVYRPVCPLALI